MIAPASHTPTAAKLLCLFILFAGMLLMMNSCRNPQKEIVPSPDFAPYVNAYTGGLLSQSSNIRIELSQELPLVDLNNELQESPFRFSPDIEGSAHWINNHTIEFVPESGSLKPGQFYKASFALGRFFEVDEHLESFEFSFHVEENHFSLTTSADILTDCVDVEGTIQLNCNIALKQAKQMLSVEGAPQHLPLKISETKTPNQFHFRISQIPRNATDYTIKVMVKGSPANVKTDEEQEVLIPAKGNFRFLSAKRIGQPENRIEITFSDPVSNSQNLKGLIEVSEAKANVLQVKGNKAIVYLGDERSGKLTLRIHEGICNEQGNPLGTSHTLSIAEQNLKPQVEISSTAAILPDSKQLFLPFRAVNLYAVDVSVIRIFESNIPMFMQTNTLESANELRRLGKLVYKKALWLSDDDSKDIHHWENYSLDLSKIIQQEPGAIYRVVLSFRQEYSAYPCGRNNGSARNSLRKISTGEPSEAEKAEWNIPNAYYYYNGNTATDWSEYKWTERDNPCHPSYYITDRSAACNVFASNMGMIVKRNSLNKLWIAVNNMLDTTPMTDAKVDVYDFQLQSIGSGTTDRDGFIEIVTQGTPFLAVAEKDGQKAYVRIIDGEELSVSRFDVGGTQTQKGLKGFVYTERGVWRPGDTLHVGFVLEDRERRIPDKHPVSIELYNPKGQFYAKQVSIQGMNNLYTFRIPTQASDPTGRWHAYVKVGGSSFHKSILIETIKPNRLKIDLAVPAMLEAVHPQTEATIRSSWLTGAKAAHLKAKVEISLSKVNTQFSRYASYVFNNPATEFVTTKSEVFNDSLSSEGTARFRFSLPASEYAPGMLNATFTARVTEPGGDVSTFSRTVPFSPFASYVGIDLNQQDGKFIETDKPHVFNIVTLDSKGNLVDRSNLEYKIYRIDWDWWWEHSDNSTFGHYVNNSSISPIAAGNLRTIRGKASFKFQVDYPDWGHYLVYVKDKESGHACGESIYVDWPDWRGRSGRTTPEGIQMLTFSLNKDAYEIGETITAIIPASAGGRALLSLENGSTILQQKWVEVSAKQDTKITFEATPEMAPNAYLHISLLQPHAQTVNDLPIRMYGIVPIRVTNRQTVLTPQIKMPEELQPETDFTIEVEEQHGRPMTYTLAIVDEGLLDLTDFKTPDPWNEFYAKEALGIRTWDMYNNVLGAFTGKYPALLSTGGDATLKKTPGSQANRFKPVVKFLGPFFVGKSKRNTHKLRLPMYVGSVRVMAVAAQDGAYGHVEKTVPVRSPLMVLSSVPRVISIQEQVTIPVNVFVAGNQASIVNVSLHATGSGVSVVGPQQQVLEFKEGAKVQRDKLAVFSIKTSSHTGKATLRITAEGNGKKAHETIEVDVRNPNPVVSLLSTQWIDAGKEAQLSYETLPGTTADTRLEVSRIPSLNISGRLDFLAEYQHLCTEQIVSKALPFLFADRLEEANAPQKKSYKEIIENSIRQLYSRQLPNGGFAYWPGDAVADEWVTSYAGMLLVHAVEKGYAVHLSVLVKWKKFQQAAAQNWRSVPGTNSRLRSESELQQSFRLYTLALAGAPEYGAMNRLKEQKAVSAQARWRLAAAYAVTGKQKPAEELIFGVKATPVSYDTYSVVYGSAARDEAMILETLVLMGRMQEAQQQAQALSRRLAREERFNTQSTAFALVALARLSEKLSDSLHFAWEWNGKEQPEVESPKLVFGQTLTGSASGKVAIWNKGKGALHAHIVRRAQLLNDTLPAIASNLKISVQYNTADGSPLSIGEVKQGTDFMVRITVGNTSNVSDYQDLALTYIFPSGWEIYSKPEEISGLYTYQDVRDDRVLTYFSLRRGEQKTFTIHLQATYSGDFILPAVQCESMYSTEAQARTKAGRTLVK